MSSEKISPEDVENYKDNELGKYFSVRFKSERGENLSVSEQSILNEGQKKNNISSIKIKRRSNGNYKKI